MLLIIMQFAALNVVQIENKKNRGILLWRISLRHGKM